MYYFLISFSFFSQIDNFKEKFELPSKVDETSGLLFFNSKIITHNDSGDSANLYEIDSLTGNLLRTISITNATNIDWEDITEDKNHIYIGDFGNNNGTRTDLTIYKILKSDFVNNSSVTSEKITFSYEDQTSFTSSNNHNFDAEAFVIYENSLLIFTKNRGDFKTNVYKIPTIVGDYTATKISTANVNGLITGATYNLEDDSFFLCGYDISLIPFLIYINENRMLGEDIFFSGFSKFSLENKLGKGNQVEGITTINNTGRYYISREFVSTNQGGIQFTFPQKLYEFYDTANPILSLEKNELSLLKISPNPSSNRVFINSKSIISIIEVYNSLGSKVATHQNKKEIDISNLANGIYFIKVEFENHKNIVRKLIKF